jgi:hypothetical protein
VNQLISDFKLSRNVLNTVFICPFKLHSPLLRERVNDRSRCKLLTLYSAFLLDYSFLSVLKIFCHLNIRDISLRPLGLGTYTKTGMLIRIC